MNVLFYFYDRLQRYVEGSLLWEAKQGADRSVSNGIEALQIWLLLSCLVYYTVSVREELVPTSLQAPVFGAVILSLTLVNYTVLENRRRWRRDRKSVDSRPRRENRRGVMLGWLFALLVLVNIVFTSYLLGYIDWEVYR